MSNYKALINEFESAPIPRKGLIIAELFRIYTDPKTRRAKVKMDIEQNLYSMNWDLLGEIVVVLMGKSTSSDTIPESEVIGKVTHINAEFKILSIEKQLEIITQMMLLMNFFTHDIYTSVFSRVDLISHGICSELKSIIDDPEQ